TVSVPAGVTKPPAAKQLHLDGINAALAVDSFSWGAVSLPSGSGGGSGKGQGQDFAVTLQPTALDPAPWPRTAPGAPFKQATRTRASQVGVQPFQTYTFTDVAVTAYHSSSGTAALALHFATVQEDQVTSAGTISAAFNTKTGSLPPTVVPPGVPRSSAPV